MDTITGIVQSIEKGVPQLAKSCLGGFMNEASQNIRSCVSSNELLSNLVFKFIRQRPALSCSLGFRL